MRQATLLMGLWMFSVAKVEAQGGDAVWNRLEVVTRLDNEGLARVEEKHELAIQGDVAVITRGFNFAADQSAVVHGIFRVGPDGSKQALKDGPLSETDSYQTYAWGVQFSLRGDNDPPFEPTVRRYAIEYTLVGAITPAWDVAAGPLPLDDRTTPRNPLTRAMEVLTDWREAWPEPTKSYRLEHDVLLPSRSSTGDMAPFDYRLEYGTAWVLKDKDRPIGVTTPDVDYRVQRVHQYLPPGLSAWPSSPSTAFVIHHRQGAVRSSSPESRISRPNLSIPTSDTGEAPAPHHLNASCFGWRRESRSPSTSTRPKERTTTHG